MTRFQSKAMRFGIAFFAISFLCLGHVAAQTQQPSQEQPTSFDIPAQPLGQALADYAEQADVLIFAPAELTRGKQSQAVSGTMSPRLALNTLLHGHPLDVQHRDDGSIAIQEVSSASDSQQDQSGSSSALADSAEPVALSGRVTDISTGANLDGALVVIEETEQRTSTDNLGRFRFPQVRPGTYTVRVSYLGYESANERVRIFAGQDAQQDFQLGSVADLGTMVVSGSRSARALALNQERTAENSRTVISSDLLGNFTGTTISEALRRASGVAFEQEFETGDGANIIVRGLRPDLNTVKFNGIELPEGSGEGRSASLNTLLTDSIDSVTISKTLLPNQDSAGLGGLVEIETKSALDRPSRFAQFSIEGRDREDDFVDDFVASAQVSGRFGADSNLGVGLSAQYREREIQSIGGGFPNLQWGAYLPLDSQGGTSIRSAEFAFPGDNFPFFDSPGASQVFPTGLNGDLTITETETLSLGMNAAWDVSLSTTVRFDYQFIEETRNSVATRYTLGTSAPYTVRPVLDRDGDELRALTLSDTFAPSLNHSAELVDDQVTTTNVLSFRGDTILGSFDFDYGVGYTEGKSETPNRFFLTGRQRSSSVLFDPGFIDSAAVDPIELIILSVFAPLTPEDERVARPLFTDAGFAALNDPSGVVFSNGQLSSSKGSNDRVVAEASGRYSFDHNNFNYLEFGVDFERSKFDSITTRAAIGTDPRGASFSDLGILFDAQVLSGLGGDLGLFTLSDGTVSSIYNNFDELVASGLYTLASIEPGPENIGVSATETEVAPYLQARFDIGDLEFIGGVRYSVIEVEGNGLDVPIFIDENGSSDPEFEEANTRFRAESVTQKELLPRLLINYRPQENLVIRAGYFKSIARPQLNLISDSRRFQLVLVPIGGPNRDQPFINISEGNENLKPAETDNYDLSIELYDRNAGVLKASFFYKSISNLTEQNTTIGVEGLDGITLPDFPTDFDIRGAAASGELFVNRRQPTNNPNDAEIWGVELAAERQFVNLPGVWGGFGVYGNYTYTESDKTQPVDYFDPATSENIELALEGVSFVGQPEHSGTAAITYNKYGIDSAIIYSAQSRRLDRFVLNGLSDFSEQFDSLDFRFAYTFERFGGRYQLSFEAVDLLRDSSDPSVIRGKGEDVSYYVDRSFLGGREFRLGLTATF